jgi:hypothetical protein
MPFNIQDFSSEIAKNGITQTNKFLVQFTPPSILRNQNITQMLSYRAESTHVPGVTFINQKVNRYGTGPTQNFPTNVQFSEVPISFIDDEKNTVWKYFYSWMNGPVQFASGLKQGKTSGTYSTEYKSYYATDISIVIYNQIGQNITTVMLKEAFPVSVGDVSLSWSDNNSTFKVPISFSFTEWYEQNTLITNFQSGNNPISSPLNVVSNTADSFISTITRIFTK